MSSYPIAASRLNTLNKVTAAIVDHDRNSQKFAILEIDADKFKFVNDNYGHIAGDEVLKYLVQKINTCLRESDSLGRIGGDEFIILLRNICTKADIETTIERIFDVLKTPLFFKQLEMTINLSIGISIFPNCSQNMDSLGGFDNTMIMIFL